MPEVRGMGEVERSDYFSAKAKQSIRDHVFPVATPIALSNRNDLPGDIGDFTGRRAELECGLRLDGCEEPARVKEVFTVQQELGRTRAQRQRLGWTEEELRREHTALGAEVERVVLDSSLLTGSRPSNS